MDQWFVYILRCNDHSLYCGVTNQLERRIAAHKAGKGARYTRAKGVSDLVWVEGPCTKSMALKREHAIKKLSKIEKEALIGQNK